MIPYYPIPSMKPFVLFLVFGAFLFACIFAARAEDFCILIHKNGVTYQAWKYPNGKTRCARTIDKHGVANGVEYRWREDGTLSFILTNIDNRIAFVVALDEGGKCRGIAAYSHGRLVGPSSAFYPSGVMETRTKGLRAMLDGLSQPNEGCPPTSSSSVAFVSSF